MQTDTYIYIYIIILYYIILYYIILYYIILYYILYYIVLYCIKLYYIILYYPPTPAASRGSASEEALLATREGSESNVRHWGPWPAGLVRPSGPCCLAVAEAPF